MAKFVPPVLRAGDSYDTDVVSLDTVTVIVGDSLTKQEFCEESDINFIVKQFGLTGQIPENVRVPLEGDFTDVIDYQSALNAVIAADRAFMEMPAAVRERFSNDAGKFVEFCNDASNYDEAIKLGIANPRLPKEPVSGSGTVST